MKAATLPVCLTLSSCIHCQSPPANVYFSARTATSSGKPRSHLPTSLMAVPITLHVPEPASEKRENTLNEIKQKGLGVISYLRLKHPAQIRSRGLKKLPKTVPTTTFSTATSEKTTENLGLITRQIIKSQVIILITRRLKIKESVSKNSHKAKASPCEPFTGQQPTNRMNTMSTRLSGSCSKSLCSNLL